MNTNPLSPHPVKVFSAKLAGVMLAAMLPVTLLAQTTIREERVVPPARDVRVVDPAVPLKKSDRDFMEKAAKASMSEVAISRVAASRTSNPDVRRFAQMMIDDHEGVIEQLSTLASARNLPLPAKDPRPEKWEKRDAKNFDREYLDQMVDDHEKVVNLFEKQAKDGVDADTVGFARKHLPKMQKHLQHALDLKRALTDKRR